MIFKRTIRLVSCLVLLLITLVLVGCEKSNLVKIKVAEVAHSVFYAPQYVAIANGYFEEEGLKIELVNANGADKVTAALLSKDVQIGLQGPEPTIYLYNNDQANYLINFAQLTRTDGSFIFGREPITNFDISMLKGKSILGGRKGGVPEMTLEYVLKQNGLNVVQDAKEMNSEITNVRTDVAFAAMAGSFLAGEGDFVTLFEPTATEIVTSGKAYLLCSVGALAGEIPYTAYSTTLNYYKNNKEILEKFTKAIYKGQQFMDENEDKVIAEIMKEFFPDTSVESLTEVVRRYREINAWAKTPVMGEDGFNRLMDVMQLAGELDKRASYEKIVDTTIAKKVVN